MNIESILLKKAKDKKLAHFYLIQNSPGNSASDLQTWLTNLLNKMIKQVDLMNLQDLKNYANLLWIDVAEDKKQFIVDDFDEMWKFLGFSSIQKKHRYIIINDAHLLTPTIMNKLLKVLEEPQNDVSFFMLNPRNRSLLPTLISRALILSPLPPKKSQLVQFEQCQNLTKKELEFHDFVKEFKELELTEDQVFEYLQSELTQPQYKTLLQQKFLNLIPNWMESSTFHQSKDVRLLWLFQFFTEMRVK